MNQVAEGLKYLASKGLRHGSLTCSKVLLNAEGVVKIGTTQITLKNTC